MYLRDLPKDILCLVLRKSLIDRHSVPATLKANLPLLAVCRQWRHLALPLVHSGVVIQHGDKTSWGAGSSGGHSHGTDGELEDAKTTTNLGLVVAAGCVHAVKRVDISVYFKANPIPGLSAVVQLMRTAAERWEGVGRLSIAVHPDGRAFDEDSIGAAEHEDDTKPICAALAATMPAVRSLDLGGYSNNNPISWTLYGRLAVLYSDQLQGIDAGCPVVVPLGCTLEQLRAVSIAYRGEIGHPRTRMDLTSIASLTLESWPPNHPWTLFGPDNGSGAIVFSGLKALDILYDDSDTWDDNVLHLNESSLRLHFPNLDRLKVYCGKDTCPLFERAVLPPRIDCISIYAEAPVLRRISEVRLPAARRLKVGIVDYEYDTTAALAAINCILAGARDSEEIVLDLGYKDLQPVLPGLLACTSISVLSIWSAVDVGTMLRLAQGLPNLASLTLSHLRPDSVQEDVSVPEPGNACLAEPFDTKLKKMCIHAHCREQQRALLIPALKCLMLRTPALAVFDSRDVPEGPIMGFVKAYSAQYPHLAAIVFRFRDNGK